MTQAPSLIRHSNPLATRLLRLGVPAGPNVLLTVPGRKSGMPRTVPVAVPEIGGRRYVMGAYGDVSWVRNLRAAGAGTIHQDGRDVRVRAIELEPARAEEFFRALPEYVASFPWYGRFFGRALFGILAPELLNDPARAARLHPVFELVPVAAEGGVTARSSGPVGTAAARSA
jgi:deazaflavin-dependent oxidoreductase (nitroreductase family)